jgi:hypothetical protein
MPGDYLSIAQSAAIGSFQISRPDKPDVLEAAYAPQGLAVDEGVGYVERIGLVAVSRRTLSGFADRTSDPEQSYKEFYPKSEMEFGHPQAMTRRSG